MQKVKLSLKKTIQAMSMKAKVNSYDEQFDAFDVTLIDDSVPGRQWSQNKTIDATEFAAMIRTYGEPDGYIGKTFTITP